MSLGHLSIPQGKTDTKRPLDPTGKGSQEPRTEQFEQGAETSTLKFMYAKIHEFTTILKNKILTVNF